MKITVLVDNATLIDRYFRAEPGLCLLLEDGGTKVLFDCGYSDLFLENARKMGLALSDLDAIVLSHGHLDHTWGLEALTRHLCEERLEGRPCSRPALVAHPKAFRSIRDGDNPELGPLLEPGKLSRHFDLKFSAAPLPLGERLLFLGEIPRRHAFEVSGGIGTTGEGSPDLLPDDSALAWRGDDGLVIVTGCSHAGICNIVDHAVALTGETRIQDVIGGLHLLSPPAERLRGTVEHLRAHAPQRLSPCHCTDLHSKLALAAAAPLREVGVGLAVSYA